MGDFGGGGRDAMCHAHLLFFDKVSSGVGVGVGPGSVGGGGTGEVGNVSKNQEARSSNRHSRHNRSSNVPKIRLPIHSAIRIPIRLY